MPSVLVRRIMFRQKTKISAWKCPTRRVCSYSQDCWSVYVQSSERLVYTASTLRIWTPHGVQCRASNPNIRLKLSSYLRLRMIQYKIYTGVMCVCIVYGTYSTSPALRITRAPRQSMSLIRFWSPHSCGFYP